MLFVSVLVSGPKQNHIWLYVRYQQMAGLMGSDEASLLEALTKSPAWSPFFLGLRNQTEVKGVNNSIMCLMSMYCVSGTFLTLFYLFLTTPPSYLCSEGDVS